jgi:hypothetical protein
MKIVVSRHSIVVMGLFAAGLLWSLFVNGAVPMLATPTLGQAASMMGYAQSFANQHWYSLHAHAFGYPVATALATGLPLAWVAGWAVRLGAGAADAYSLATALWITVGYVGAHRFARMCGARAYLPALSAAAWMSLPMVWAHQGYSSLGLGLAMLPLYVSSAMAVLDSGAVRLPQRFPVAVWFIGLCLVAIFMDGYTFMMFGVAAAILFVFRLATDHQGRVHLLKFAVPVYVVGFIAAFLVYSHYVGRSGFESAPLDFFRGWGLDVTFLGMPPSGEFWLWDGLGWAQPRSEARYFGDASVWTTTFALPLAVAGIYCMFSTRKRDARMWALLAIAVFGFYMALGPTLKINSVKPETTADQSMPAHMGLMPTGNALLSEYLPGFRNMRASYRWEALFLLGMWGLIAVRAGRATPVRTWPWGVMYVVLIVSSMPHLLAQWNDYRNFHRDFTTIDRDVAAPLAARIPPGSRVFFVPYTNDVMVNYLSPKLGIVAYNVGGDKQIDIARSQWPVHLRQFEMNRFDETDVSRIRTVLLDGDVDVVVVPYFNSLWAAHLWPCVAEAKGYSEYLLDIFRPRGDFLCPSQIRTNDVAKIAALSGDEYLHVDNQPLFALVTLKREYASEAGRQRARARLLSGVTYPLDVVGDAKSAGLVLGEGWNSPEPVNRWSQSKAELTLPMPSSCVENGCKAVFRFITFAASPTRPVEVSLTMANRPAVKTSVTLVDEAEHELVLAIPKGVGVVTVNLDVPAAVSPAVLGMSSDGRVLGISLKRIDLQR